MPQNDTLQHYQIQRHEDGSLWELGRGAMGVTYKAFDVNLRCPVALKLVNGVYLHDQSARMRFVREARAAAGLRHRNVASVHHLSADGDDFFYAMEFIDGETVSAWVRRVGRLPTVTALRITLQVARALGAAHKRGLVHRDVKPANLMVVHEDDDEHFVIKLIDFGLVRVFRDGDSANPPSTTQTVAGFVGTPLFASPEQLEEHELDTRSDIYSLGLTLWFMLTGQTPFTGTLSQLYRQHATLGLPWERLAGMPEPLLGLMRQMLQKDPGERPQNPTELRGLVTNCLRAVLATDPGAEADELEDEELLGGPKLKANHAAPFPEPVPEMTLANGLRLGPLVGEGSRGRVFRANDPRREGGTVAVKVFHHGVLANESDFERLRVLAARARTVPHPNLLEIISQERYQHFNYLVTESVNGCTLVGLLGKRGRMTVPDCLQLLRQAAAAASHARVHGLPAVELALHQILVHFPGGFRGEDPGTAAEFEVPLADWPEFFLKLDPLSDAVGGGALATWSGEVTLINDTRGSRGQEAGLHEPNVRPLGILVYELLCGTNAALPGRKGEGRSPMTPLLGEAGNAVLRRAVSAPSSFASEEEFFRSLAEATGFDPRTLQPLQLLPDSPASPRSQKLEDETRAVALAVPATIVPTLGENGEGTPASRATVGTRPAGRLRQWFEDTSAQMQLQRLVYGHPGTEGPTRRWTTTTGLVLGTMSFSALVLTWLAWPHHPVPPAKSSGGSVRPAANNVTLPDAEPVNAPISLPDPSFSTDPLPSVPPPPVAESSGPRNLPAPVAAADPNPDNPGQAPESKVEPASVSMPGPSRGAGGGENPGPHVGSGDRPEIPMEAVPPAGSPAPVAAEPGAKDEKAGDRKPEIKKSTTRQRTFSRGGSRRKRQRSQPNLIQRIFGIKPK